MRTVLVRAMKVQRMVEVVEVTMAVLLYCIILSTLSCMYLFIIQLDLIKYDML